MIGIALGKLDINYKEKTQGEIEKNKNRVCSIITVSQLLNRLIIK